MRALRTCFAPVAAVTLSLLAAFPCRLAAQIDLTVDHKGIAIGDVPRVIGLRINYRDRHLEQVDGVNATIWSPYSNGSHGLVRGVALGLPVTGAYRIDGVGLGILGVGAEDRFRGIGVGAAGVGSGGNLEGIMVGGLGVGSGGDVVGIGVGASEVRGLAIGGLGAGARDVRGALVSGGWTRLEHGTLHGLAVGSFNQLKGTQRGLAIGIVNYAEELHGVQVGLINIARNNSSATRVLPIVNVHRD
jgi:hypothetical protein